MISSLYRKKDYHVRKVAGMKVKCSNRLVTKSMINLGYTPSSELAINVGSSYKVAAMCIWNGLLMYLVRDEDRLPKWYPASAFRVEDNRIPDFWLFSYSQEDEVSAIWGYLELVCSESHFDELSELTHEAVAIALKQFT